MLEVSGWTTGRVVAVRSVQYLVVVLGCERIGQGVETVEGAQGDR